MKLAWQCQHGECENPRMGSLEYCASCSQALRRLAKDMNKIPKERKGIRKASAGRTLVNEAYKPLRLEYLRHHTACEINLSGCTRKSFEIHHASTSADDFLNSDTWFACCRNCHVNVETKLSADERRLRGLLI